MRLKLQRGHGDGKHTPGEIVGICKTLELPWQNNERNISCIIAGTYYCVWEFHHRHRLCVRLHNVAGRDGILIHTGNLTAHTEGCILPGIVYNQFTPSVTRSLDALLDLYRETGGNPFWLEVLNGT